MPTHTIGRNNTLVGLCLDRDIKAIIGKEATAADRSVANFIWSAALGYFRREIPVLAVQIDEIQARHDLASRSASEALTAQDGRQQFFKFGPALACLLVGAMAVAGSLLTGDDELRRTRTTRVRGIGAGWARRAEV